MCNDSDFSEEAYSDEESSADSDSLSDSSDNSNIEQRVLSRLSKKAADKKPKAKSESKNKKKPAKKSKITKLPVLKNNQKINDFKSGTIEIRNNKKQTDDNLLSNLIARKSTHDVFRMFCRVFFFCSCFGLVKTYFNNSGI